MINPDNIHNGKILIFDDEKADVELLEGALRDASYTSIASTMNPHKASANYTSIIAMT